MIVSAKTREVWGGMERLEGTKFQVKGGKSFSRKGYDIKCGRVDKKRELF